MNILLAPPTFVTFWRIIFNKFQRSIIKYSIKFLLNIVKKILKFVSNGWLCTTLVSLEFSFSILTTMLFPKNKIFQKVSTYIFKESNFLPIFPYEYNGVKGFNDWFFSKHLQNAYFYTLMKNLEELYTSKKTLAYFLGKKVTSNPLWNIFFKCLLY